MEVKKLGITLSMLILLLACSTKKNTYVNRKFHEVNTYFNVLFNGRESYQQAAKQVESIEPQAFDELLPVFAFQYPEVPGKVSSEMHRAITKAEKAIMKHSITAKPKKKRDMSQAQKDFMKLNEYNPWVSQSHLLIGQAQMYLHEYGAAESKFAYINTEYAKDDNAVAESRLCQAIIANRENDLIKAESILQTLSRSKKFPPHLEPLLHAAYADFYIQKKTYPQAIVYLNKALDRTYRRSTKIRYHYLLAQLYQKTNDNTKATEHFTAVLKLNPPYLTAFSAEMALAYSQNPSTQKDNIRKTLAKALKDPRNEPYIDQIYYALAKIEESSNAMPKAIEMYQKSIEVSSNDRQKALANIALAKYYIQIPDYIKAYNHYDRASKQLPTDHTAYKETFAEAKRLRKLGTNLEIVHQQDSLQNLAKLSERERKNFIQDKLKQDELAVQAAADKLEQASKRANQNSNQTVGQWYFYNPTALSMGQSDFQNKWGGRKLEDNWRRRNKSGQAFVENEDETATGTAVSLLPGADTLSLADKMEAAIPTNNEATAASDEKIASALFFIGEAYRDDIQNLKLSIQAFEDLNQRFPKNNYQAASYVALYQLYTRLEQTDKAQQYRTMMLAQYPKDPQVLAAADPTYVAKMQAKEHDDEARYMKALGQYTQKLRTDGVKMDAYYSANKAIQELPESRLKPQFMLLRTMSDNYEGNMQGYQLALKDIITQYPKSDAAKTATGLLAATESQESTYIEKETKVVEVQPTVEGKIKYDKADGEQFFVIVADSDVDLKKLQFEIQSFNAEQYIDLDLELQVQDYSNRKLVLTGVFKSKKQVTDYFNKLSKRPAIAKLDKNKCTLFCISDINLFLFRDSKTITDYYNFFKVEYLK